jgi:hypothetical protein
MKKSTTLGLKQFIGKLLLPLLESWLFKSARFSCKRHNHTPHTRDMQQRRLRPQPDMQGLGGSAYFAARVLLLYNHMVQTPAGAWQKAKQSARL